MLSLRVLILFLAAASGLGGATRLRPRVAAKADPDSVVVAWTIASFHAALAAGDSAQVESLLGLGALILESGGIETRDEYLGGHLRGDIAFASAVPRQPGGMTIRVVGEVAIAASTSVTQGEYRGRPVNSAGAELMILVRSGGAWKIAAVHWSSRARRQP